MQNMIELQNVTKRYGSFRAVDAVSLAVPRGELFGFLGVNGAGKTTTLRMLAGVLLPTAGRIRLGDYDLGTEPEKAKAITGYIPDRPYLYAKLTGREFLHFCADLYNVPHPRANERIDQLLAEFNLSEWQNSLIDSYSHGMKQRLATCSALVHEPQILIIDEPIVGLDPHGAKLLKESLRRYTANGMTIFLSTHSLHVAEEVCDRLAIIHRGALLTVGTLAEIRQRSGSEHERLESVFIQITSETSDTQGA